jgi:hypothetical protein
MKKYIVLSVNSNVDYLYFAPLTCWSWRKLGWDPIVFYHDTNKNEKLNELVQGYAMPGKWEELKDIPGFRSDTITQISRLYGSCFYWVGPDDYLLTGDVDMLALSNYWQPDPEKVTVYGHDLTGYGHYPICYIGMKSKHWHDVIHAVAAPPQVHIERDLKSLPQAGEGVDWEKRWFTDQDLITSRLNEYGKEKITFVNRGQYSNGFAAGRVDRGSWSLDHSQFIDAHLMQQTHHSNEKIQKLMELLHHVWPGEDFKWFLEYTKEFKKMAV